MARRRHDGHQRVISFLVRTQRIQYAEQLVQENQNHVLADPRRSSFDSAVLDRERRGGHPPPAAERQHLPDLRRHRGAPRQDSRVSERHGAARCGRSCTEGQHRGVRRYQDPDDRRARRHSGLAREDAPDPGRRGEDAGVPGPDPAKGGRMDFEGFMQGYTQFFGTPAQPHLPVRSAMQVAALANPGISGRDRGDRRAPVSAADAGRALWGSLGLFAVMIGVMVLVVGPVLAVLAELQLVRTQTLALLEIGEQAFVGQIERMRLLPVMLHDLLQPLQDVLGVGFERELAPRIEAAGRQIDRADDGALLVREQHLAVQLQPLELVHPDADVLQDAQPADRLPPACPFSACGAAAP